MPAAFGFLEQRLDFPLFPEEHDPSPPPLPPQRAPTVTQRGSRLTPPLRLDTSNAHADAYGIAILIQCAVGDSELSRLRWENAPEEEMVEYQRKDVEEGILTRLATGRRIADDDDGRAAGLDDKERFEHLVIRDWSLPALVGRPGVGDDVACGMGLKAEEAWHGGGVHPNEARIVCHAEWTYRPRDWRHTYEEEKQKASKVTYPRGTNVELVNEFAAKVGDMSVRIMEGKEHYGT